MFTGANFSIPLLYLVAIGSAVYRPSAIKVTLNVDTNNVVTSTNNWFLSLGMDSNLIRKGWETFNFTSERLLTLAKGLGPAYLRLSGTDADRMIFQQSEKEVGHKNGGSVNPPRDLFPPTNFTMSMEDWDKINIFSKKVCWRIVFGLNVQLRKPWLQGSIWDPQNALSLLKYSIDKGYSSNLDFELGNEPDLYFTEEHLEIISGRQLARDYNLLADTLRVVLGPYYSTSKLYGPAFANMVPLTGIYLKAFLDNLDEDTLEAVTWHQYYGGSELKYLDNYTDPRILDNYIAECRHIVELVRSTQRPDVRIWQGETSSTYAPPENNIDETYVAGFMLLDKLGVSASCGMDVVIRQTFYGFWFALVDQQLQPTPNYWVALLYRRLVGPEVLKSGVSFQRTDNADTGSSSVRMYAHCLSKSSEYYIPGAVVMYGMNLLEKDVLLDFSKISGEVVEFLLSPLSSDLMSQTLLLNGEPVRMPSDSRLPSLRGHVTLDPTKVRLPSKRLVFYVIRDARASIC